jgi:amidophosphoribosyltransferase
MAQLCRACFDGVYPVGLPESAHLGKHMLEQTELPIATSPPASMDVDGVTTGLGIGGGDALRRP